MRIVEALQRYAVVSCHVERVLDDEVWGAFERLLERRPAGFVVTPLLRPPSAAAGEDTQLWLERARRAAAVGAARPPHALGRPDAGAPAGCRRRSRDRARRSGVAARARPRARVFLRRRLVSRRTGRGGARRVRLRRLLGDHVSPELSRAGRPAPAAAGAAPVAPLQRWRAARAAGDAFARHARPRPRQPRAASFTCTSTTGSSSTAGARSRWQAF